MEKETSCINSRAILSYLKKHYNGDYSDILKDLDPEIDRKQNPESFLTDPNNWISCTVASKLYERTRLILNDHLAAFNIAKYAAENFSLGYGQSIIIKALWSHKKVLRNLQKINDRWNRNKKVELVQIKGNYSIIRLHWAPTMDTSKDICLYNQGAYTFMPITWGGKPLTLKEKCCFFEGAPYCEYHITMPFQNRFHEIFSSLITSKSVLRETINEMEAGKEIIEKKYEEVNKLNVELNNKIKQLMAIQETGKAILSVLNLEQLLTAIMNILSSVCRINRALIMLVNEKEDQLKYFYSMGFDKEVPDEVKQYKVSLDRVSNILARVTSTGRPEYIPEVQNSSLRKENIMLIYSKPTSLFIVPLITRSRVIGVIATDATDKNEITKETRDTLETFAPQIAIAIENAKLYNRLQEQMDEIKQSHALLSRVEKFSFLGNLAARLAHEIKNPMTAIGTFIQLLPQKYDDEEFRNDFHEIAMAETNRVNNLITELLDLCKNRESHLGLSVLSDLINKMVLLVSPQSNEKKIEVVCNFDPAIGHIWLDPEKMKEVVLNLLSNAVNFTPQEGKIEISTKKCIDKLKPETIQIEIKDNGAGIPESMFDKVFDPYFTTKHRSDIHSGTGLGLFIAHQNMQDHGGTIEVKSKINKGTTFILTLPVDPSMSSSNQ